MARKRAVVREDAVRARLVVAGGLCGREGCDSFVDLVSRPIEVSDDRLRDVYVKLCDNCRRALCEGRWTPTRQEDRVVWRPNEKQLHPVVQGALNRDIFRVPSTQWLKEFEIYGREARLDFVVLVQEGNMARNRPGLHIVEVKLADDKDQERLDRQIRAALASADFVWLAVVDADPEYADERVGLLSYSLRRDDVRIVRDPERLKDANTREGLRRIAANMRKTVERLDERVADLDRRAGHSRPLPLSETDALEGDGTP